MKINDNEKSFIHWKIFPEEKKKEIKKHVPNLTDMNKSLSLQVFQILLSFTFINFFDHLQTKKITNSNLNIKEWNF